MTTKHERFKSERYAEMRHLRTATSTTTRPRQPWPPATPKPITLRWLEHVITSDEPSTYRIRVPYAGTAPAESSVRALAEVLERRWQHTLHSTTLRITGFEAELLTSATTGGELAFLVRTADGDDTEANRRLGELARREARPRESAD